MVEGALRLGELPGSNPTQSFAIFWDDFGWFSGILLFSLFWQSKVTTHWQWLKNKNKMCQLKNKICQKEIINWFKLKINKNKFNISRTNSIFPEFFKSLISTISFGNLWNYSGKEIISSFTGKRLFCKGKILLLALLVKVKYFSGSKWIPLLSVL